MVEPSWYVIQTKPRRESGVVQLLTQAGVRVFNPLYRERYYRIRQSLTRVAPLFPGYLFIDSDLSDPHLFQMIRYTRGVTRVLGTSGRAVKIADEIIATIKKFQGAEGIIDNLGLLNRGDFVKVKKGLLKELVGILQNQVEADGRVQVLFKLASMTMKAEMHWTEVEKIGAFIGSQL